MSVRPAQPADAAGIGRVHVRAWRHAYADLLDPQMLAELDPDEHAERWLARLADPGASVWVFDLDGYVAGFTSVAGEELTALYVDPAAQGAGVGTALLREAVAAGARLVCVFEANGHGRTFYERFGWRPAGPAEPVHDQATLRYTCS